MGCSDEGMRRYSSPKHLGREYLLLPSSEHPIQKHVLPSITAKSSLPDFVGPRSTVIFCLIDIPHSFLADPLWRQTPEYDAAKSALSNLSAVNDSCERALALATKFNGNITKDEDSFQELVLAVEAHRKTFNLQKKSDLKKLF